MIQNAEQEKHSYYTVTPTHIIIRKDLKPNQKLLFGLISSLCNLKGYCWSSNSYFADLLDVDKNTVSDWINDLKKKKIIDTIIIRDKNNTVTQRQIYINNISQIIEESGNSLISTTHKKMDTSPLKNGYLPMKKWSIIV